MTGQAVVLPGRLALVADHLVLALREEDTAQPSFVLSWYAVTWSADSPPGNLAFVRSAAVPGGELVATDVPDLDRVLRPRLRPRSWPLADPDRPAVPARFERLPIRDGELHARVVAGSTAIDVAWRDFAPPIVANGRAGAEPPWDTSTVLIEAGGWSASIGARDVPGAPFPNDVWIGWFGRPLSSALVAVAEVFREVEA